METETASILRITEQGRNEGKDTVVAESYLTIVLDSQELVTLLCSPTKLDYLAVGFLASEGFIKSKDEIEKIIIDDERGIAQVTTRGAVDHAAHISSGRFIASSGGKGFRSYHTLDVSGRAEIKSYLQVRAPEVFALMEEFGQRSKVFQATGGVHSAALCDITNILIFSEDIGRHNAVDKIFGECILKDISTDDRIILTSGRVSSEILLKVARRNIPILLSKSAPTNLAIKLAADLGMTLIGFARGRRMNVYSVAWRIVPDEK